MMLLLRAETRVRELRRLSRFRVISYGPEEAKADADLIEQLAVEKKAAEDALEIAQKAAIASAIEARACQGTADA